MPKKIINSQISDRAATWYRDNFRTATSGATYALEAFYGLCRNGLAEVKRAQFTGGELGLIIDVTNSLMLTPGIAGQHLSASVSDAIALDGADQKWGVKREEIIGKLETLSLSGHIALEIWAKGFWERHSRREIDLDDYIAQLSEIKP